MSQLACMCALMVGVVEAQSVSITKPVPGIVVQPGSLIDVLVTATGSVEFVSIGGNGAVAGKTFQPPFQFQVQAGDGCQDMDIVAFAKTPNGAMIYSNPVKLRVDCTSSLGGLEVSPQIAKFQRVGQTVSLSILLRGTTGGITRVQGLALTLTSSNKAVVIADSAGILTATGPGNATINARVAGVQQQATVLVSVPGARPGDLDGDGDVDSDDLAILQSKLNRPATTQNDACDLNRDAKIDALDARILATLCTRLRCAVQ